MTDEQLKAAVADLVKTVKETSLEIRELKRQSAARDKKWGTFTEGLAYPAMTKILGEKLGLDTFMLRPKRRRNGEMSEYDVMGYTNGARNAVAIVEVKSPLRDDAIEQLEQQIEDFGPFYPEHAGKDVYGVIAGVDIPEQVARKVVAKVFYLAQIHDEEFELMVPRGFKPKAFHPRTS